MSRIFLNIAFFIIIMIAISNVSSAGERTFTVELAPSTITINSSFERIPIGESFNFTVEINTNLINASGSQIYLNYNKSVLRINKVSEGSYFKNGNLTTFFDSMPIGNSTSQILLIYGVILGPYSVSKANAFCIINATAVGYGTVDLGIFDAMIVSPEGYALIPLLINNKTIVVYNIYDMNNDRVIDINDLNIIKEHFGERTSYPYPIYDVNKDGKVNVADLRIVAMHFGDRY